MGDLQARSPIPTPTMKLPFKNRAEKIMETATRKVYTEGEADKLSDEVVFRFLDEWAVRTIGAGLATECVEANKNGELRIVIKCNAGTGETSYKRLFVEEVGK